MRKGRAGLDGSVGHGLSEKFRSVQKGDHGRTSGIRADTSGGRVDRTQLWKFSGSIRSGGQSLDRRGRRGAREQGRPELPQPAE